MASILRSYNRAFIVGNGFDLNCGYKTSYKNFIESQYFKEIVNNNDICQILYRKHKLAKWIDVENEFKEIYKGDISFPIEVNEKRKTEFIELCGAINKYMNQIDSNLKDIDMNSVYLNKTLGKYDAFNDSYVICFNYTQTIKELIENNNSNGELIMLHGEAKDNTIILGVEDAANLRKEYDFYYKTSSPYYNCGNVLKQMKDVKEFIFMGHSFGETDHYFFSNIFKDSCLKNSNDNFRFTIYHYGMDDKRLIVSEIRQIIGKNGTMMDFYGYNNVEFIDVMN